MAAYEDFTEVSFRDLLFALKAGGYRFVRYGELPEGRHVLWRHDVDFSMHRAAKLAAIEAEEGALATYFLNPRSVFYNLLEPEIHRLCKIIQKCGHDIGLHFDSAAYGVLKWRREDIEIAVEKEKKLLEMIIDAPVASVSWHNPELYHLLSLDNDVIAGLYNSYAASLKRDYVYCSDSNGYWRFQPMLAVIEQRHDRLHLLTHPEWWPPVAMSPSDRVDRAIFGRAHSVRAEYDALLQQGGRKNLK